MLEQRCLNCNAARPASARFCMRCGQRTDTARLSLHDVRRDLMHSFVDIEHGPLAFAWALLVRPGKVARDYVQGKRRRHYGPFATLVVLVGMTTLAMNLAGFRVLAHDGLPATPTALLEQHFNLLLLAQLPLLGCAAVLVFRAARLTLAEHMVLAAYALGVRALFLALLVPFALAGAYRSPAASSTFAFWIGWYVYYGWAATQFYDGPRWRSWLGGSGVAALAHAAIMAILYAVSSLYERYA